MLRPLLPSGTRPVAATSAAGRPSDAATNVNVNVNDDDEARRIDRQMEFAVYLQEMSAVEHECRHLEQRWRSAAAARSLADIAAAASAAHAAVTRRLADVASDVADLDARTAAAAAGIRTLADRLDAAGRTVDDVRRRVAAASASADAHHAETTTRFDGVAGALEAAGLRVGELAAGLDGVLATASELRGHAIAARATLDRVAASVTWLGGRHLAVLDWTLRVLAATTVLRWRPAIVPVVLLVALTWTRPSLRTWTWGAAATYLTAWGLRRRRTRREPCRTNTEKATVAWQSAMDQRLARLADDVASLLAEDRLRSTLAPPDPTASLLDLKERCPPRRRRHVGRKGR